MGAQDSFDYALEFVTTLKVTTPTMVWDPSFTIWRQYGINVNSSMILLNAELTEGTRPFNGFDSAQQQRIIEALDQFN
ncbi:MAG: hypothetical protein F4Y27_02560 [Acidimicrobiaceae bacterium]|nr:hypothetical protein [Acidimicrobiaceae bacterium]MXW61148.1 hypothetical protein [Acidimicrobiaceae bacterium]MXW74540.1 hypothetical protein [Acidimicrobiaceae bacterium]MYA73546.1 hypothetical protein [Acidimicrobiaceae bacterium]MYC41482.1 hypothetical protein [Acidimicrobiaceae bacterium]